MFKAVFSLFALLFCLFLPSAIPAQEVREGDMRGTNSSRRQFDRAAEKQSRSDWLQPPYEGNGTQVRITFDAKNADVMLMTPLAFGKEKLLAEAQQIVQKLALPQTDFITIQGSKTTTVDLEFNDYLKRQRWQTDFAFNLSALAQALETSALPRPIVIGIDPTDASQATLTTQQSRQELNDFYFAVAGSVAPGTQLQFQSKFSWHVLPMVGFFVFGFGMVLTMPWRLAKFQAKRAKEPPKTTNEETVPDPEEVQSKYDKAKPLWMQNLLIPLLALPAFLLIGTFRGGMNSIAFLVPVHSAALFPAILFGGVGLSYLGAKIAYRNAPKSVETEEQKAVRRMFLPLFIPMIGMMIVVCIMTFVPIRTPEAAQWRKYTMLSVFIVSIVGGIVAGRRMARGQRETLTAGFWYDMVQEMAGRADLTVKRVVLTKSDSPNAFASIFGTVGLTKGLIEKLEPEEVRAVIAHELGHIKKGHPKRNFALGLAMTIATLVVWFSVASRLRPYLGDAGMALFNSPILWMSVLNIPSLLVVGRLSRRYEREADALAVQWTGDPNLVIRSLTQIHTLNASPHRLKQSDEALHSHPSLEHRIEAIRQMS